MAINSTKIILVLIAFLAIISLFLIQPAKALNTSNTGTITHEELNERAKVCLAYTQGALEAKDIIDVYNLKTERERRDFELQCNLFIYGIAVGNKASGNIA